MPMGSRRVVYLALAFGIVLFFSTASFHPHTRSTLNKWSTSDPKRRFTTPEVISTFVYDSEEAPSLAYRQHLERTTSLRTQLIHSKTMTFDHIYVLSLPTRQDRRDQMNRLARALGLELTFVDAANKDEPFVRWIAERVVEVRKQRLRILSREKQVPISEIGGLHIGNDWLTQRPTKTSTFPSLKGKDHRFPSGDWVSHLEKAFTQRKLHTLIPQNPNLNITDALWDPLETIVERQVNEGVISTFWGHTRAMKMMIQNKDKSALILEDDVDFEWDLERLWARIENKLPEDWDTAFLGHCWGRELLKPMFLHPLLHPSSRPLCLHAYALSAAGVERTMTLLNNPWTAYQTAVDTAIPTFIWHSLINSFSVDPPMVIQRKDGPSDIQTGIGSSWRGYLMDSTADRVHKEDGLYQDEIWDPQRLDPATVYRYSAKGKCNF